MFFIRYFGIVLFWSKVLIVRITEMPKEKLYTRGGESASLPLPVCLAGGYTGERASLVLEKLAGA